MISVSVQVSCGRAKKKRLRYVSESKKESKALTFLRVASVLLSVY